MNPTTTFCVCLLAVSTTVSASEFNCTALPGTYEQSARSHAGRAESRHRGPGTPARWASFTVVLDKHHLRFRPAVPDKVDANGQAVMSTFDLAEVEGGGSIERAFSGGSFDPSTGRTRTTRAHMLLSPVKGRFVLNVFDFDAEFTTHYTVRQERFKADCGEGAVPIPLEEYVPLMKRSGLWPKNTAGTRSKRLSSVRRY